MSDHLIAEANRHAKALTDERNNLVVEMNLLREWQQGVIENARAHHAERKDAIARAERAEAELAAERARLDWLESDAGVDWQWSSSALTIRRAVIDAAMKEDAT